ncbi:putative polyketide synthase [Rosellinia necatrix]|uniref:Putative polyketide synthase n=1 Tax=Rosellinia necatrix TaxID=77044 RepID=A0A1S8AA15_ROSNE|nr:putative polyketide synthase [Rosellinia necatrix]
MQEEWTVSKKGSQTPTLGFIFTGQGAQWPQMGKDLLRFFPWTREILQELDDVLRNLAHPPSWSLISELTEPRSPEHLQQPEFSQCLVTALQLCIVAVLEKWRIRPTSVVGHSSGEIAAAYTAGLLDRASAITSAFYRGKAATLCQGRVDGDVGMLAVGLGADATSDFLQRHAGQAWIACFNSPGSVTVSGKLGALEALRDELQAAGHFARRLKVDMAYHTELMGVIGNEYEDLLDSEKGFDPMGSNAPTKAAMFSSVTASRHTGAIDAAYWKQNMVSAVQFDGALRAMLSDATTAPNFLIEIGPSGALAGPVSQVLKSIATSSTGEVAYCSAWNRGAGAGKALFDVAGRLWATGHPVDLALVNEYNATERCITDLPNYSWDHSTKYWHENAASKEWRFRKYVVHDLLGSKILGTSWHAPTWRSRLNVSNVPFLMDHRIGGNAIMPGAGFITMALEAMYQKHCVFLAVDRKSDDIARNDLGYRFRNVRFSKALVLEEGKEVTILFTLTATTGSKDWHEFRVYTSEGEFISDHCSGSVRIQDPVEPTEGDNLPPLKLPEPAILWYKWLQGIDFDFGPSFQKLIEVETITGGRVADALISLEPPEGKYHPQSYYPVHPAALDGCMQTTLPVMARNDRATTTNPLIPALIDDFVINKAPSRMQRGRARATSVYSGRGRLDELKSWLSNVSVYDVESGQLVVQIAGIHYAKLDVAPKPDIHTFHSVIWKPDITFLTRDQAECLTPQFGSSRLDTIVDLIAHKKPCLRILELNLDERDTSCIWFDSGNSVSRAAYLEYVFGSPNVQSLVHVETLYTYKENASFLQILIDNATVCLPPSDIRYDLVIIKIPNTMATASRNMSIDGLRSLIDKEGYILVVDIEVDRDTRTAQNGLPVSHASENRSNGTEMTSKGLVSPSTVKNTVLNDVNALAWDEKDANISWNLLQMHGFRHADTEPSTNSSLDHLSEPGKDIMTTKAAGITKNLIIATLSSSYPRTIMHSLKAVLGASNWNVTHKSYPFPKPTKGTVILVLDDLWRPVLTQVNNEQWGAMKMLISWGTPLLWVTEGAQGVVTNPDNAMIHGLFRVARQEDPHVKLTTLDVHSSSSPATTWAIERVLDLLKYDSLVETEYMERDGILHIQRVMPDDAVNDFRHGEDAGFEPIVKGLHTTTSQVELRAERLGTLEGLMWCETEAEEALDVGANNVEVEVMAIGVNFKDVAIVMGIVPDDEYSLGVECAGVVRRLGQCVSKFKVGDRVCMLKAGTYANRVRVPVDRCHIVPTWMTFEEAAIIPSVYLCSLYAMYHLGGLQENQSVLIHSATGGVGIACIELALYKKAEIFVTVGTDEKRQFLESKYGIPQNHMFSSRTTEFATGIMKATGGCGINVVINSLTGQLLDASWRIMADGGNMVEIGKRDILDRNTLSMEPFDRNCSFRAIDMSYSKHVNDQMVGRLFDELFTLIDAGHIKPSHPITTFGFDRVADALSHIRSGRHLGKLVISNGNSKEADAQIPIRPAIRRLRLKPGVSYLIVGGLRGACGTLAVQMAQHGARRIIVNSRSGILDEASARIVASCNLYKCEVIEARGDVGDVAFVRWLFASASLRIAGIIQGAMVLRDKPLEMMTVDDYHTVVHAKVRGTKNLHQVSEEMRARDEKQHLDFFTMLSSTSGIVGNKGQANYAAANTFLDAFASYRQSMGLRANTVDLGVIEDVGVLAGSELQGRFDTRLWTPINERMLRKILTYSVLQQDDAAPLNISSSAQMITGISYPLPIDGLGLAGDPRFAHLFNSRAGDGSRTRDARDPGDGDQTTQAIQRFRRLQKSGSDAATLMAACVEVISAQVVRYLQLDTILEAGRSLMAYGLDSLSAVELRNWIRGEFGVELTTLDITSASSLLALCEKVVSTRD